MLVSVPAAKASYLFGGTKAFKPEKGFAMNEIATLDHLSIYNTA